MRVRHLVGGLEAAAGLDQRVPHPYAVVAGVLAGVAAAGVGAATADQVAVVVELVAWLGWRASPPQAPGSVTTGADEGISTDLTSSHSSTVE